MLAALTLPMSLTMHYVMRLRYNVYARMYVVIMNSSKDRADSRGMIEMIKYLCIRERGMKLRNALEGHLPVSLLSSSRFRNLPSAPWGNMKDESVRLPNRSGIQ